jgi:hypothetical protein
LAPNPEIYHSLRRTRTISFNGVQHNRKLVFSRRSLHKHNSLFRCLKGCSHSFCFINDTNFESRKEMLTLWPNIRLQQRVLRFLWMQLQWSKFSGNFHFLSVLWIKFTAKSDAAAFGLISKGYTTVAFAPSVVQETTTKNDVLNQIVNVFPNHFVIASNDAALLSINSLQRSLSRNDPIKPKENYSCSMQLWQCDIYDRWFIVDGSIFHFQKHLPTRKKTQCPTKWKRCSLYQKTPYSNKMNSLMRLRMPLNRFQFLCWFRKPIERHIEFSQRAL